MYLELPPDEPKNGETRRRRNIKEAIRQHHHYPLRSSVNQKYICKYIPLMVPVNIA